MSATTFSSVTEIKRANRAAGQHFFDRDTLEFFGSRVDGELIGGRFFLTSERSGFDLDAARAWTVREARADGRIDTFGFLEHATRDEALAAAHAASEQS